MYTRKQFAKMIDQSLLRPEANKSDVLSMIEQAKERHFAAVVIFPCWVATAAEFLEGTDIKVCTVVSYPFGADTRNAKIFAIRNAIANGANEIDAVLNISKLKSGNIDGVKRDLNEMVDAVRMAGETSFGSGTKGLSLKVTIETCYLSVEQIELVSRLVRDAGADFVQTSTGTGSAGATCENIRLIRRAIGPSSLGIKAAGGIRTITDAVSLLDAGANRIGTSAGVALIDSYEPEELD
jgi:deoxyribose-phosphate aldolase